MGIHIAIRVNAVIFLIDMVRLFVERSSILACRHRPLKYLLATQSGQLCADGMIKQIAGPSRATAPGNWVFANATEQACTSVDQGIELNAALGQTAQFPDLLIHMISVGEQAGMLETMLQRAADYYETRVDNAIDRLIPLLEPAMMVALGGLVGGLMLAMYLPLFQMGSVLG